MHCLLTDFIETLSPYKTRPVFKISFTHLYLAYTFIQIIVCAVHIHIFLITELLYTSEFEIATYNLSHGS